MGTDQSLTAMMLRFWICAGFALLTVFAGVNALANTPEARSEARSEAKSGQEHTISTAPPPSQIASLEKSDDNGPNDAQQETDAKVEVTADAAVAVTAEANPNPKPEQKSEPTAEPNSAALISNKIIATLEPSIKVTVEGQLMSNAPVSKNEKGALFVRAEQIFESLNDDYEFDAEQGALIVRRSQDGVVMELYTDTGLVKSDGKAIGKLRVFGEITPDSITLTPNAIAVLAGTKPKLDKLTGDLTFELDARLRVASGFKLYLDDIPLGNVEPAAKSIGPVLLLPLIPIARELGHNVDVASDFSRVTVQRSQDSAIFSLDLETGLVERGGRPIGISKDVTYIDQVNLLLPVSAMETLTGTHITVTPGTDRVDIRLDERLKGAIEPGEKIADSAAKEPFTVEELTFHTGIDTHNTLELDFRVKKFNGRLRYSTPDLPTDFAELEPDWLSIDYAHLDGATGTLGDYSANLRELDGVGIRRIRGASFSKVTNDGEGRWSLAAGLPVDGARAISDDQSRASFGGFAAGLRYADDEGWEAGLSFKQDSLTDDQMVVLSAISGRLGQRTGEKKISWDASADIGLFNGEARQNSFDIRADGTVRRPINDYVDVDIHASYAGAEFQRGDLEREALDEEILDLESVENQLDEAEASTIPDIRITGQDSLSIGGSVQVSPRKDVGILGNPGASAFVRYSQGGVRTGQENATNLTSYGLTGSSTIKPIGAHVTFDYSSYNQSFEATPEVDNSGSAFNIRAYRDFEHVKIRGQYSTSETSLTERDQRLGLSVGLKAHTFDGPKEASLAVAPSVNATWTPENSSVSGGVIANANSGEIFGPKTRVQASLGVLQSFGDTQRSDQFFTASIARQLKLNDNLALSLSYRNDLQGDSRLGIQLDGHYGFNEKRKYKSTQDNAGVLTGTAFMDHNRDGVQQESEQGVGGVTIRVGGAGRKLALRSDRNGFFTIQNIPQGIFEASIDNRSLPIGFSLADDAQTRITISDGHISRINLPIVQRGQVRGFAFVDADGNGEYERSEERLEGARLRLSSAEDDEVQFETVSTSFGQYAFDDLPAGTYSLEIIKTNVSSSEPGGAVSLELSQDNDLMARLSVSARPAGRRDYVDSGEGVTTPPEDTPESLNETALESSPEDLEIRAEVQADESPPDKPPPVKPPPDKPLPDIAEQAQNKNQDQAIATIITATP